VLGHAGTKTQGLMLKTIFVLPNIPKHGISVSVATITLLEMFVQYFNLMYTVYTLLYHFGVHTLCECVYT